ncbi:hypothetical protein [Mycoplasma sp. BRA290]|uniref:hypothetical protein n=1 Tax=Mycoplasma sp. BRA290 TaxID=3401675 RepID=UPI003AAE1C4F
MNKRSKILLAGGVTLGVTGLLCAIIIPLKACSKPNSENNSEEISKEIVQKAEQFNRINTIDGQPVNQIVIENVNSNSDFNYPDLDSTFTVDSINKGISNVLVLHYSISYKGITKHFEKTYRGFRLKGFQADYDSIITKANNDFLANKTINNKPIYELLASEINTTSNFNFPANDATFKVKNVVVKDDTVTLSYSITYKYVTKDFTRTYTGFKPNWENLITKANSEFSSIKTINGKSLDQLYLSNIDDKSDFNYPKNSKYSFKTVSIDKDINNNTLVLHYNIVAGDVNKEFSKSYTGFKINFEEILNKANEAFLQVKTINAKLPSELNRQDITDKSDFGFTSEQPVVNFKVDSITKPETSRDLILNYSLEFKGVSKIFSKTYSNFKYVKSISSTVIGPAIIISDSNKEKLTKAYEAIPTNFFVEKENLPIAASLARKNAKLTLENIYSVVKDFESIAKDSEKTDMIVAYFKALTNYINAINNDVYQTYIGSDYFVKTSNLLSALLEKNLNSTIESTYNIFLNPEMFEIIVGLKLDVIEQDNAITAEYKVKAEQFVNKYANKEAFSNAAKDFLIKTYNHIDNSTFFNSPDLATAFNKYIAYKYQEDYEDLSKGLNQSDIFDVINKLIKIDYKSNYVNLLNELNLLHSKYSLAFNKLTNALDFDAWITPKVTQLVTFLKQHNLMYLLKGVPGNKSDDTDENNNAFNLSILALYPDSISINNVLLNFVYNPTTDDTYWVDYDKEHIFYNYENSIIYSGTNMIDAIALKVSQNAYPATLYVPQNITSIDDLFSCKHNVKGYDSNTNKWYKTVSYFDAIDLSQSNVMYFDDPNIFKNIVGHEIKSPYSIKKIIFNKNTKEINLEALKNIGLEELKIPIKFKDAIQADSYFNNIHITYI